MSQAEDKKAEADLDEFIKQVEIRFARIKKVHFKLLLIILIQQLIIFALLIKDFLKQ